MTKHPDLLEADRLSITLNEMIQHGLPFAEKIALAKRISALRAPHFNSVPRKAVAS